MASWARAEARMVSGALACALHGATLLLLLFLTAVPIPPQLSPTPLEVTFLPPPEPPLDLRPEPAPGREEKAGAAASPPPRGEVRAIVPTAAPSPVMTSPAPLPSGSFGLSDAGTGTAGTGAGREAAGGPGSGQGRDGPAGPAMVGPDWITRPTDAQMRTYFPRTAIERRTSGVAWLGCQVDAGNRARRCRILGERPAGLGFGAAGLRLSRLFRIRPPRRDGRDQYDAWVRVPIYFDIE
jgi:periplasmic protein TonB